MNSVTESEEKRCMSHVMTRARVTQHVLTASAEFSRGAAARRRSTLCWLHSLRCTGLLPAFLHRISSTPDGMAHITRQWCSLLRSMPCAARTPLPEHPRADSLNKGHQLGIFALQLRNCVHVHPRVRPPAVL